MGAAVKAGAVYFIVVFAAGFALGAARSLVVAPRIGALGAVLVELPLILSISWIACGVIIDRFRVPPDRGTRLAMGAVAFFLLMAAELALSVFVFGRSVDAYGQSHRSWSGGIGLAGQIAFALIPLLRVRNVASAER